LASSGSPLKTQASESIHHRSLTRSSTMILLALGLCSLLACTLVLIPGINNILTVQRAMQIIEAAEHNPRAASELDMAIDLLEQALATKTAPSKLYQHLAHAYHLIGDHDQALLYTENAYRSQPNSLLTKARLAELYEARGDQKRALAFKQLLGFPNSQLIAAGTQELLQAQYRETLDWYQRAAAGGAQIADSLAYLRYHLLIADDRQQQAIAELQRAVNSDREWAGTVDRYLAWFHWGRWLVLQGRHTEAIAALTIAVQNYPAEYNLDYVQSESYRFLALAELARDAPERALQHIDQALLLDENNAWAYVHFGQILAMKQPERLADAEQAFASALELQPGNVAIWQHIALLWRQYGNAEASAELCHQAEYFSSADFVADYCTTEQVIVQ
jgi:tetratricopeptide (TPR) repeat protein